MWVKLKNAKDWRQMALETVLLSTFFLARAFSSSRCRLYSSLSRPVLNVINRLAWGNEDC